MRSLPLLGLVVLAVLSCGDDSSSSSSSPGPRRYEAVPETGKVEITSLSAPVDVVRDKYGMVHIHAKTLEDALRVEGYQCARDRTVQLELIRRSATGRMAELLGDDAPDLIDSDIAMRTIGLARTAKAMVEKMSPEERKLVDAYADGITWRAGTTSATASRASRSAFRRRTSSRSTNVWDSRDARFRDDADRWSKNENRPVPFATKDVVADAESRLVYSSP